MHLANNQPIRALMDARWRTPTLIAVTAISLFSPAAIGEDNGCHEHRSLAHAVGPTLSVVTLNMEKNKDCGSRKFRIAAFHGVGFELL
jgi:hypothetical protein